MTTQKQLLAALAVCERVTAVKGKDAAANAKWWDLVRDPKVGYEALLREHLRLMDEHVRLQKLVEREYPSVLLLSEADQREVLDALTDLLEPNEALRAALGGAPAQEKEQAK